MFGAILFASTLFGSTFAGVIRRGTTIWATPHDSYSSSVGVLGCHINTNRVAYWPAKVDCDKMCVKVTHGSRSLYLLRVDQSGGAHDMSYDAWNELVSGQPATSNPQTGGPVEMSYEDVDMSNCADLIFSPDGKLPFSAANSMNFISSCIDGSPGSWVAKNYVMYNVLDPICSYGFDEPCTLNYPAENTPSCTHQTGLNSPLVAANPVVNIKYPSGEAVEAATGTATTTTPQTSGASSNTKKAEGGTFKEASPDNNDNSNNNNNGAGIVSPLQALVILGAMLKNALRDA